MRTFRPSAPRAAHRLARPSALALFAIAASGAAFVTPAQALERTTTFSCVYPYVGEQPVSVVASGSFSPSAPYVGQAFSLLARTTSTLAPSPGTTGASSVEVRSTSISLSTTSGPTVTRPAQKNANGTYTSDFTLSMPPGLGHYPFSVSLGRIGFTLVYRDANGVPIPIEDNATTVPQTDGDPDTFQIECALAPPGQDTVLASTFFGDPGPPPTPPVTPSPSPTPIAPPTPTPDPTVVTATIPETSQTGAKICWSAFGAPNDTLETGVYVTGSTVGDGFNAATDPYFRGPVGGDGCATVTGLRPGIRYRYYVVARKADGELAKIATSGRVDTAWPDIEPGGPPPLGASSVTYNSAVVCWYVGEALHQGWMALQRTRSTGLVPVGVSKVAWYRDANADYRLCATLALRWATTYEISLGYVVGFEQYALEDVVPNPVTLTTPPVPEDPISTPTPTPTPTATPTPMVPTPTPSPTGFPCSPIALRYEYDVSGTASVKTLTKGSVPLTGETTLSSFCGAPGAVPLSGPITFAPATANLTALGFLPVSAKVALVATEPLAGSAPVSAPGTGAITLSTKVRIKLPSVKVLGIELAGGANCQAKQVSALTLKSTQPSFTLSSGGAVAGSFSISDLSGCGFLTGIVSPLTSGAGNLIALNLTPRKR